MTPPAVLDYRDQIERADEDVALQQHRLAELVEHMGEPGSEAVAALTRAAIAWATDFNRDVPASLPPDARDEIRDHLLRGIETLSRDDFEDRLLDRVDELLLSLEAVRHILRDAAEDDRGTAVATPAEAVALIDGWLPGLDRAALARLLGVDPRTLQRWQGGEGGRLTPRVRLVVQLVALLRTTWTTEGVVAWFHRPRRELGGAAPVERLDDAAAHDDLRDAARRGRASHGA
jgi:transcriptional regulator with XRE-family HTH domain